MLDKDHRRRLERAMNRTVDDWMGDLAATLLGQTGRYQDRDASDTWMEFEHFGEFYAAQKHQFVVGYSSPDVLALRVLRLYMHRQLSAVVQREAGLSSSESFESVNAALTLGVEAHKDSLLPMLRERWPKEWADIVSRNSRSVLPCIP